MPKQFFCAREELETSRVALLGIPFDATSSFRPGSRFAPDHIRLYSEGIESYSPYQHKDLAECAFTDAGNIDLTISNFSVLREAVHTQVIHDLSSEKKVLALGGEHLISLPVAAAYAESYPDLKLIHLDAHADLREDYLGEKYSHATVIRRISEIIGTENIYQFGIRSGTREEFAFGDQATHFYPFSLNPAIIQTVVEQLQGSPVYLTLDLDVLDPAYFPGTGTPEPGGVSFQELLQALLLFEQLKLVGADIVELCPAYDRSDVSTITAIKLVRELLLMLDE
ncbi:agmatinase [Candidatus Vecturithrix granuli]|uniref:Agmatinase n=1 Tax=Vecturithrix granuli TaxID=1499967 RepID=A0A081C1C5_VECG1|nr:agmatinase [Candidatus Vecturithrix granuli]